MTPYHDSLWKDAPEGATHWGVLHGVGLFLKQVHPGWFNNWGAGANSGSWSYAYNPPSDFTDLHPRPQAYHTAAQLIEAYRKEHGMAVEADAEDFMRNGSAVPMDHLLDSAVFSTVLIEKYLAAERKRIEESAP